VVFRWLLGFIHPILLTGWARKGAALLTLVPVGLYALLAGMSPSTQRALIMVAVFLLTFLVEREHDLMNTLAVAALAICRARRRSTRFFSSFRPVRLIRLARRDLKVGSLACKGAAARAQRSFFSYRSATAEPADPGLFQHGAFISLL
jgi:hypothetical protein